MRERARGSLLSTGILLTFCLALPATGAAPPAPGVSPQQAAALFARFAALAGTWRERSTRGWTGGETFRVIADGSVVMATSRFDDDAGDAHGMATMIALDGDRLLLTHYCEAHNQSRLVASAVSADGATVTFTFLDGGNLPDRDVGHMDSAVFHFVDESHYTSRWTWYQNGQSRWMEETAEERTALPPARRSRHGGG